MRIYELQQTRDAQRKGPERRANSKKQNASSSKQVKDATGTPP